MTFIAAVTSIKADKKSSILKITLTNLCNEDSKEGSEGEAEDAESSPSWSQYHSRSVTSMMSLDDRTVLSASDDLIIKQWSLDGTYLRSFTSNLSEGATQLLPGSSSCSFVSVNSGFITLWDESTPTPLIGRYFLDDQGDSAFDYRQICVVRLRYQNEVEAIAGWFPPNQIRIWRLEDGSLIRTIIDESTPAAPLQCICILESQLLVTGGRDGEIKIWNMTALSPTRLLKIANGIAIVSLERLASSSESDGEEVIACSVDGTFTLWDVTNGLCLRVFFHNMEQNCKTPPVMTLLRNNTLCMHQSGITKIWNLREGRCIECFSFVEHREMPKDYSRSTSSRLRYSEFFVFLSSFVVRSILELKDGTLVMGLENGLIKSVRRPIK